MMNDSDDEKSDNQYIPTSNRNLTDESEALGGTQRAANPQGAASPNVRAAALPSPPTPLVADEQSKKQNKGRLKFLGPKKKSIQEKTFPQLEARQRWGSSGTKITDNDEGDERKMPANRTSDNTGMDQSSSHSNFLLDLAAVRSHDNISSENERIPGATSYQSHEYPSEDLDYDNSFNAVSVDRQTPRDAQDNRDNNDSRRTEGLESPLVEAVLVQDASVRGGEDPLLGEFEDEEEQDTDQILEAKVVQPLDFLRNRNGCAILAFILILLVALIVMAVAMVLRLNSSRNEISLVINPTMQPTVSPTTTTPTVTPTTTIPTVTPTSVPSHNIFVHSSDPTIFVDNTTQTPSVVVNATENQTFPPAADTASPTFAPTAFNWTTLNKTDLVLNLPLYSLIHLQDPASPQSLAYDWLESHPAIDSIPEWRKEQLYALATFYFAMNGDGWLDNGDDNDRSKHHENLHWLNYSVNECEWGEVDTLGLFDSSANLCYGVDESNSTNDSIGQFQQLRIDDVLNFQGTLPPEVSMLTILEQLVVLNTNWSIPLEDAIPTQLADMQDLRWLQLESNLLYGSIPTTVGSLSQLTRFRVNGNLLTNTIPTEFGELASVELLYCSNNKLNGTLPSELGTLGNLSMFRANNNELEGGIPTELGLLTKLSMLVLFENKFTGAMPTELFMLTALTDLWLYSNDISGTITSMIGQLTALKNLRLAGNKFAGVLPSEIGLLTDMTSLTIHNNDLRGTMPVEVCSLPSLKELLVDCAKLRCPANCHCSCCGIGPC